MFEAFLVLGTISGMGGLIGFAAGYKTGETLHERKLRKHFFLMPKETVSLDVDVSAMVKGLGSPQQLDGQQPAGSPFAPDSRQHQP